MDGLPSVRIEEIALLGDGRVGKTALLNRFKGEPFDQEYRMTVGADFVVKRMEFDGFHITLQIWDVAGQQQFSELRSRYYRNAAGVLIVFDLTDRSTYESIPTWLNEVLYNNDWRLVPMMLVGNKNDLISPESRIISSEEIELYLGQLQQWGLEIDPTFQISYIETSAKYKTNVDQAFMGLLNYILSD